MNKTKIVCSIGPASCKVETIEQMIDAGMSVARFNMSHGTHDSHKTMIDTVKRARENKGASVGILIDTKRPEIRVKQFEKGKVVLKDNDTFVLTSKDVAGTAEKVSITYKNLPKIIKKDAKILLNDGNIELKVTKTTATEITCLVVHGGELSNNKSINIPGIKTDMPYLSETDKADIAFAKEMDADFIAISFVNCAQDVQDVRNYLKEIKFTNVQIISKIESEEGVKNFDKILKLSDGIMVARGDLGVEIDFVKIPILQKEFISKCNQAGKIVITATQMLESMIQNARPTRAEISDVANAVFDGSTCIMLSGETASGNFPVETIKTMKRIALESESYQPCPHKTIKTHDTSKSLGYAVYSLAKTEDVTAIVAVTRTGITAENISRFRPNVPIIACTPNKKTFHKMSIMYGVVPVMDKLYKDINQLNNSSFEKALATNIVKKNDKVVLVSGLVAGKSGSNLMFIKKL
jgi:pyruvate kinase